MSRLQPRSMPTVSPARLLLLVLAGFALAACDDERQPLTAPPQPARDAEAAAAPPANVQPQVVVYKTASCGCCGAWIEHLESHGFPVEAHDVDNLDSIKQRVGVPYGMGSCHTAEVGGYFIEGHVPATEIQRLLTEKPHAKGLTVPGMPVGSPGMEQGGRVDPYRVLLVHEDGSTSVYAEYPK